MTLGLLFIIVPIGLFFFVLEFYFLFKKKAKITLDQTALNMSLGFFDRLVGLYLTEKGLILLNGTLNYSIIDEFASNAWTFVLTFIAIDFIWYVFHVTCHRISLVWGMHLIHHQSNEYNLSVNFALSPLGFIVRTTMYSSLILLGFPIEFVIISIYLNAFYQFYLHTEFISSIPILEKIFVMPDHHKVHHGSNSKYLDRNYGGVFIIWDKIFKTYAPLDEKPKYGLTAPIPHKDFLNIQLFFFKKLINNFKNFGIIRGLQLLFLGPEHQTPEIPKTLRIESKITLTKVIIGSVIYLSSYLLLVRSTQFSIMILIAAVNLVAILIVNGISFKLTFPKIYKIYRSIISERKWGSGVKDQSLREL
jgi:sterol desaturase/sphingolipid hydroxylase (fatty acid hydroxylase superfamily)